MERHQNNPEAVIEVVKMMVDEGEFPDKTIDRDLRERTINSLHAAAFLQQWGTGKHLGADDGDEKLERSVHSVEVMGFVAESSPVAVCEWDLHLREEYLLECRAKIVRHIRRICELIQATVAIRLCSTDSLWRFVPSCLSVAA